MVLNGIFPTVSPLCWRDCGKIGDQTHIFWDCLKIKPYWMDIRKEIFIILGLDLPLTFSSYILGCIPTDNLNTTTDKVYILNVLLLIAKKMITISWKKPSPPTMKLWTNKLKDIYTMERLTAQLRLKNDSFQRKWTLVKKYFEYKQISV